VTGQDPLLQQPTYASPRLVADVVMKGGITSGIVYPRAVARLAQTYSLKNVGGTSAGAIAAAAAAAAEHGRHTPRGGFAALAAIPAQLAEGKDGDLRLLRLFQPEERTSSLFRLALAVLANGKRGALSAVRLFPLFPLLGLFLAVIAIVLAALGELGVGYALAVCITAIVVAVAGAAVNVIRDALTVIPDNDFGLCRLFSDSPEAGKEPLTVWLHEQLQALSGKDQDDPLTFGDLWGTADDAGWDPASRTVNLEMITTDLTHGRPLRLPVPFRPKTTQPREAAGLLFDPDELGRYFPASVVRHMESCAPPRSDRRLARLAQINPTRRLRPLPLGADLPVLVAARMSLSFPLLISAIPLWELEFNPKASPELKRVLFSDGGISSNFPVHFFDAILPRRPTFGISLTNFPAGKRPDPDQKRNVDPPPLVAQDVVEPFRDIQGMLGFATAIKDAAQNWRDNAQALIPGFKERIAHVKLDKHEGGLNLDMDKTRLDALAERGECAGGALLERFAESDNGSPYSNWNRYRFARFRIGMALIERTLRSADQGLTYPPDDITATYAELIAGGFDDDSLSYRFESRQRLAMAEETTALYEALVETWGASTLDDEHVPRPEPDLRIVPPA
jgi:hypothetical protein